MGRAGQGRGQGLWLWEKEAGGQRCQGPAQGCRALHLPPAVPATNAVGPPALQAPIPPPACAAALQEGPATCSPHPPPGGGNTEARGAATPGPKPLPERQAGWSPRHLCCWLTLQSSAAQGPSGSGRRPRGPETGQAPGPSPYLVNGAVSWCGGWRLSCRYPLAFSHITRLAGPDSSLPAA